MYSVLDPAPLTLAVPCWLQTLQAPGNGPDPGTVPESGGDWFDAVQAQVRARPASLQRTPQSCTLHRVFLGELSVGSAREGGRRRRHQIPGYDTQDIWYKR